MTPICNCASRTPTYPTFRETEHLPDCVWEQIRRLQLAVAELATQIDTADEPQESAEMRVERILNYGIVAYHQGSCQVQAPPAATPAEQDADTFWRVQIAQWDAVVRRLEAEGKPIPSPLLHWLANLPSATDLEQARADLIAHGITPPSGLTREFPHT